jgi:hypothetical protein
MSMWNPHSESNRVADLKIQFNTAVSADGYARVRDNVLLTRGVSVVSEDSASRTMVIKPVSNDVKTTLLNIPGVESIEKTGTPRPPNFGHRL